MTVKLEANETLIREMSKYHTMRQITVHLNCTSYDLKRFCKKNNIELKATRKIKDYEDDIRGLVKTKTLEEISEIINYSVPYVRRYLQEIGLETNDMKSEKGKNDWWKPLNIGVTKDTLVTDYHQWWCFVYKQSSVRKVTFDKYRIANGWLREVIPNVQLKDMTRSVYQDFMNQLGKIMAKQTLMDTNNQIKRSLKDAVYEGLIDKDPTYGLELSGKEVKHEYKKFASQHEVDLLLETLEYGTDLNKNETKFSWFIFLGVKTGFRMAETLGLTSDNFDFENNKITIDKSLNYKSRKVEFQPTKNKASMRTIDVDSMTMTLFKNLIKDIPEGVPIFAQDNKRIHNATLTSYLTKKCEEAGIPRITSHSLRHTHASILLANGVSMQSVSKRLGHADLTTTQDVYSHITDELAKKDGDKINKALAGLGGF
jgi:integrase